MGTTKSLHRSELKQQNYKENNEQTLEQKSRNRAGEISKNVTLSNDTYLLIEDLLKDNIKSVEKGVTDSKYLLL